MMTHPNALKESASQTAGPYVHLGCVPSVTGKMESQLPELGATMIAEGVQGERIQLSGRVFDGGGEVVKDALIEVWQADHAGLFSSADETPNKSDPNFTGWGRQATGLEDGLFSFETIKPGQVPWPGGGMQAPHIALMIAARGINLALHTRVYFGDETDANAIDPVLLLAGDRAGTMIAEKTAEAKFHINIRLQGEGETVFIDV